ncbi:MAG: hypothetical protein KatS3mg110_1453 [Pirellulaceae bacterium]|nr:MAG: hypothetical protein KatS3mg110_1453 [Pirellulaceae bacterium]
MWGILYNASLYAGVLIVLESIVSVLGARVALADESIQPVVEEEMPTLVETIKHAWSRAVEQQKYVSCRRVFTEFAIENNEPKITRLIESHYRSCNDNCVLITFVIKVVDVMMSRDPSVFRCGSWDVMTDTTSN